MTNSRQKVLSKDLLFKERREMGHLVRLLRRLLWLSLGFLQISQNAENCCWKVSYTLGFVKGLFYPRPCMKT